MQRMEGLNYFTSFRIRDLDYDTVMRPRFNKRLSRKLYEGLNISFVLELEDIAFALGFTDEDIKLYGNILSDCEIQYYNYGGNYDFKYNIVGGRIQFVDKINDKDYIFHDDINMVVDGDSRRIERNLDILCYIQYSILPRVEEFVTFEICGDDLID